MNRTLVLGAEIDRISFAGAIDLAFGFMNERRGAYVVTPNTEIVLRARKNLELRRAIRAAVLSLPDSVGVVIACRILGTTIEERIPGIDFAAALLSRMAGEGRSVFLLGAREGVAARAADALCAALPGLVIAGTGNGYFNSAEEDALINRINAASPDLLLVCLGAPRQELWMHRNASRLRVGLMAGLGGALDVFSGDVPRAPARWRQGGFEWLYRLVREPKRIKRAAKLPLIIFAAAWDRIKGERNTWQKGS
ncbi:MAG: WecB/TagA/CpsF family glycosyltransferase [Oscillospiraceae bacterium]|nr:WecB/TagA/CpsF family glycosyltransferase [Oscillospiraceae bacterium]